jgi:hypothetical protein
MTKYISTFLFVLLAYFSQLNNSIAKTDYNSLGKQGHDAWKCSIYAEYASSSDEKERQRLFEIGYDALTIFIQDGIEGKINKAEYKDVPIIILWQFTSGPTTDFRLGQIWHIMLDFYGKEIIDGAQYSDETKKSVAKTKYISSDCQTIK